MFTLSAAFAPACAVSATEPEVQEEVSESDALRRKDAVGTWRSELLLEWGNVRRFRHELNVYANKTFALNYVHCKAAGASEVCAPLTAEELASLRFNAHLVPEPMQGSWRIGTTVQFRWGILEGPYYGDQAPNREFGPRTSRPLVLDGTTAQGEAKTLRIFELGADQGGQLIGQSSDSKRGPNKYLPSFTRVSDVPDPAYKP